MILLCVLVIWCIYVHVEYKRTDYYNITRNSYESMRYDSGKRGEFFTYRYLREYEAEGAKFLFNCYLPKNNVETTEIDMLMIHTSGIYVFESKNYSGWIFGSENQRNWTQTLPSRGGVCKEHFWNPIIQNKVHIKWLQKQIGGGIPIHSVIVFSEHCELKRIEVNSPDTYVVKRNMLNGIIRAIDTRIGKQLSQEQIDYIYMKLYPYTQVSDAVKEQHIRNIQTQKAGNGLR